MLWFRHRNLAAAKILWNGARSGHKGFFHVCLKEPLAMLLFSSTWWVWRSPWLCWVLKYLVDLTEPMAMLLFSSTWWIWRSPWLCCCSQVPCGSEGAHGYAAVLKYLVDLKEPLAMLLFSSTWWIWRSPWLCCCSQVPGGLEGAPGYAPVSQVLTLPRQWTLQKSTKGNISIFLYASQVLMTFYNKSKFCSLSWMASWKVGTLEKKVPKKNFFLNSPALHPPPPLLMAIRRRTFFQLPLAALVYESYLLNIYLAFGYKIKSSAVMIAWKCKM